MIAEIALFAGCAIYAIAAITFVGVTLYNTPPSNNLSRGFQFPNGGGR
jgi:hypothetical protein